MVLRVEQMLLTCCSSVSFVSKGKFSSFSLWFADKFDTDTEDWKPNFETGQMMSCSRCMGYHSLFCLLLMKLLLCMWEDAVAQWLWRLTPDRALRVWALDGVIALYSSDSWAQHTFLSKCLSQPMSINGCQQTLMAIWQNAGGNPTNGLTCHRGERRNASCCYGNWDNLW